MENVNLYKEITLKIINFLKDDKLEQLECLFESRQNILEVEKHNKEFKEAMIELRKYMFSNIYLGNVLKEERNKAKFILRHVIEYYYNNSDELPELYKKIVSDEGLKRGVADYIAGMTDDYCISTFNKIYVPKFVIY